ncbi:hypothetical protein CHS0354_000126 [Potamilus streckersoni]|uniref:Uncharacterized protein n=1 Tax=Potamilus streckersoni TaxID=2493646 RepID=A0AAE0RY42_9BIVA|nr:hypothetical protein CHS0354_000126 [Potamilus streckersoni]
MVDIKIGESRKHLGPKKISLRPHWKHMSMNQEEVTKYTSSNKQEAYGVHSGIDGVKLNNIIDLGVRLAWAFDTGVRAEDYTRVYKDIFDETNSRAFEAI